MGQIEYAKCQAIIATDPTFPNIYIQKKPKNSRNENHFTIKPIGIIPKVHKVHLEFLIHDYKCK